MLFAATDAHAIRRIKRLIQIQRSFHDVLSFGDVSLAGPCLAPWSRWVTPIATVMSGKRFDARFFVAAHPPDQDPMHDQHEATECVWIEPKVALEMYWEAHNTTRPATDNEPCSAGAARPSRERAAGGVARASRQ